MSTEVAIIEPREIVITGEQTELIKRTICQGATDAEMQLFFFDCQRRGVHPLDKLIHFTKRKGKYVPITSIDFFRIRAHGSGVYAGEEEPIYEVGMDGYPDSCKYLVYRLVNGQRFPWTATARWAEYYPGDELGFNWRKMPFLMLAKCAEALALRKAFPAELQGLYVKEEMDQAGPLSSRKHVEDLPEFANKAERKPAAGDNDLQEAAHPSGPSGSAKEDAPPPNPPDDPAEPYRAKLRTCERSQSAINVVWAMIPEPLKQDCYACYSDQLKSLQAQPKGKK